MGEFVKEVAEEVKEDAVDAGGAVVNMIKTAMMKSPDYSRMKHKEERAKAAENEEIGLV